eukprot:723122_1
MASDQTNLGIFGEGILAKHCGRNITSKFYNTSIDDAVLLTESQMANVALKNTIEFLFFLLLSVSLQTILTIYIRYMQRCCGFCDSGNDVGCRKRLIARSKCANIIRYFLYTWTIILCLVVLAHFISGIYHYYSFVNDNVHFDVKAMFMEENIKFEYCDSVWGYCGTDITREHCHIAGIGNIACPALFDDQEGSIYLPFYTEDAAESVCSWVFYLLIPSNAAIFQYSILTSFILFDTVAFFAIISVLSVLAGCFCVTYSWIMCWFGCCCDCSGSCFPHPPCVCDVSGGGCHWCCDCCTDCTYCWYWWCGVCPYGFIMWFLLVSISAVLALVLILLFAIFETVIGIVMALIFLVTVMLITGSIFCPLSHCREVLMMFIGSSIDSMTGGDDGYDKVNKKDTVELAVTGTVKAKVAERSKHTVGDKIVYRRSYKKIREASTDHYRANPDSYIKGKIRSIDPNECQVTVSLQFKTIRNEPNPELRTVSTSQIIRDPDDWDISVERVVALLSGPDKRVKLQKLKKIGSIISIFGPLFMVLIIAMTQSLVSIFIIFYAIDAVPFFAWVYYKPIAIGIYEYMETFVKFMEHPEQIIGYLKYILSLSIEWSSLFDFSMKFESFKFTVLFLRAILYTLIGVMDALDYKS